MNEILPQQSGTSAQEIHELAIENQPPWLISILYTFYIGLVEVNAFLEKWGSDEIVQTVIECLPPVIELVEIDEKEQTQEQQEMNEDEAQTIIDSNGRKFKKKKRKKKNNTLHPEQDLIPNQSRTIELEQDLNEAKVLFQYPPFKFKHLFKLIAPQLTVYVNNRLDGYFTDKKYVVHHIVLKKNHISFILTRIA